MARRAGGAPREKTGFRDPDENAGGKKGLGPQNPVSTSLAHDNFHLPAPLGSLEPALCKYWEPRPDPSLQPSRGVVGIATGPGAEDCGPRMPRVWDDVTWADYGERMRKGHVAQ